MNPAIYEFENYAAVIPMIQNVYGPEEDRIANWTIGFKYVSGMWEHWAFSTFEEAKEQYDEIKKAINGWHTHVALINGGSWR